MEIINVRKISYVRNFVENFEQNTCSHKSSPTSDQNDPANSNWMKKRQNMPAWLSKNYPGPAFL
jgi:hypothetical protein